MRRPIKQALIIGPAAAALLVGGFVQAQAAGPTQHDVRSGDVTQTNAGNSTHDFLREGIHLKVPDAGTDYAVGVFSINKLLSDIDTVTYQWDGTQNRPGVKLNVDVDGDGAWDCQLVNEQAYGNDTLYLNKDTQDSPDSALPEGTCADAAPNNPGTEGSGQPDGTIGEWNTSLDAVSPDGVPNVVQAGYGASGLVQDGVLESITLGDDAYTFTDEVGTDTPVTGRSDITRPSYRSINANFKSGAGSPGGTPLKWTVRTNGYQAFSTTMNTSGEKAQWKMYFQPNSGTHTVQIYKNGDLVKTFTVNSHK